VDRYFAGTAVAHHGASHHSFTTPAALPNIESILPPLRRSVREVAASCTGFAECLSSRDMGHPLVSRFTGKPLLDIEHSALGDEFVKLPHMSHNTYYPSPEMHEDVCQALLPVVRKVLSG
jgi:hypothetical protein